jgi:hypothetical protein
LEKALLLARVFQAIRVTRFSAVGRLLTSGCFVKVTKVLQNFDHFFNDKNYVLILTINGLGYILGDYLTNSSGFAASQKHIEQ